MKVLGSVRQSVSATEADDENSEGEGRGKKRRRRGSGMINYQEGEEEVRSRLTAQVRLTGKAMRMKAQGKGMVVSDEEEKFDEEIGHTDVKLEPDGNLVLDGEVLAGIRKLNPGEEKDFHGSMKVGWVQICPFCKKEVGSLVDHVKGVHPEREHRQIRTICPYVECSKLVVDIKNHIRMVHLKVRNYSCDECDANFVNNYQVRKHKEGVHSNGSRIQCEECSMMLKTTTYESHVRRVHRGVRPSVPCDEEGCGKVFGSKADLERHVLGKHMKWKLPCPECGKSFRSECLMQHIQTVHRGIYPFPCPHCKQGFQNQKGLATHVRTRHRGVYLYCRAITSRGLECGKVLLSEEGLINHMESQHFDKEVVKSECPQCSISVLPCYLPEHVRRHHLAENGLVCPIESCGLLVESGETDLEAPGFGGLQKHVELSHGDLGLEWCCNCEEFVLELAEHNKLRHEASLWEGSEFRPVYGITLGTRCHHQGCDFMATGPTHLTRHVKLKHENKVSAKCELCGKKSFDMERHHRIQHQKEKTLECDLCNKKFLTPFALKKHQQTHTAIEERTQTCLKCGVSVANMKQHERFVHQKDLPFSCPEQDCQTKFTSSLHLRKHMESVHNKAKLACPQCKKMIGVNSLASHIRIVHQKQRNSECPECHKTFQNKSHLRNHLQRVHLGMKQACPDCGKQVQDLHSHRQYVHLKVRNFPCNQCDTRCTTSNALKKHISSVHLDQRSKCPECLEMVKHLEQHIRQRHRDAKRQHQCAECQKFFTCGTYLAKHIMRVHLEMKATCTDCGLETKDLSRHKKTNCTREGYVPRTRKKSKFGDASIPKDEVAPRRKPRIASTGLFWENEENKMEVELKEEELEESGEKTIEDPVTSEKEHTSEEPQEVKDEDEGSVISSLDITEDQDEHDNSDIDVEKDEGGNKDGLDKVKKKFGDLHGEEDDFVIVTPILEDEEYSSNELILELEDDDLFFEANKSTGSLVISS